MGANSGRTPDENRVATRREALARPGIDPNNGQPRPIQLADAKLKTLPRMGAGKVKEAAYIVPEVLLRPAAVFRGLTQDADEPRRGVGWLCYAGRPSQCFEDDGRAVSPPRNRVFLVFVNDEWIAYNWYWCMADPTHTELPEEHASRFHERLI